MLLLGILNNIATVCRRCFFRIDLQFVMFTFQKIYITMPYVMGNVMKKTSKTSPLSFEIYIKDNYFHVFIDGLGLNLSKFRWIFSKVNIRHHGWGDFLIDSVLITGKYISLSRIYCDLSDKILPQAFMITARHKEITHSSR